MEIVASDIGVTIAGRTVLEDVNARVVPGQTLALVGPSGSGKTTLLNVLGLLVPIGHGTLTVNGRETRRWKDARRRAFWQHHAAFVFQDYGLIEEESVAYNVMLSRLPPFWRRRREASKILPILERVGLPDRAQERVSALSGGEKQRVGLARAMFRAADVIFADEPTASLDRENRELVTAFLLGEAERGAAVVIATHDEDLIPRCDARVRLGPGPRLD